MEVTLLASTRTHDTGIEKSMSGYLRTDGSTDAELLISAAGRQCYESFHRPNPQTHSDGDYIRRTIGQMGHWSIAEHASATFLITGVSRNLTHELIRHRHLSFSQLSQRFCDESQRPVVVPPAMEDADENFNPDVLGDANQEYQDLVQYLGEEVGLPRKKAREAARYILPSGTETAIVVTGNHRAWHEMLVKRLDPGADAEIRKLAQELLAQLRRLAPSIYEDL